MSGKGKRSSDPSAELGKENRPTTAGTIGKAAGRQRTLCLMGTKKGYSGLGLGNNPCDVSRNYNLQTANQSGDY